MLKLVEQFGQFQWILQLKLTKSAFLRLYVYPAAPNFDAHVISTERSA